MGYKQLALVEGGKRCRIDRGRREYIALQNKIGEYEHRVRLEHLSPEAGVTGPALNVGYESQRAYIYVPRTLVDKLHKRLSQIGHGRESEQLLRATC
jgi:hypothetical protein